MIFCIQIIKAMLDHDPTKRPTAKQVHWDLNMLYCIRHLDLSPLEELFE